MTEITWKETEDDLELQCWLGETKRGYITAWTDNKTGEGSFWGTVINEDGSDGEFSISDSIEEAQRKIETALGVAKPIAPKEPATSTEITEAVTRAMNPYLGTPIVLQSHRTDDHRVHFEIADRLRHPFQYRVQPWMLECFGPAISADTIERNHRFLEEALELVQACGATAAEAHQLVDYVYGRPIGEKAQEVGGVMVTLAALCLAQGINMHEASEVELARVWTKIDQIRAKQATKPKGSPLPQAATQDLCVACQKPIAEDEPAFHYDDGPVACEACAPTIAELIRGLQESIAASDDAEDIARWQTTIWRLNQRIANGEDPDSKTMRRN